MYPTSFENYMSYCGFTRTPIAEFFNNYKQKPQFVTKQVLTKWLTEYAKKKGYTLIVKSNGKYRYYDFDNNNLSIAEQDIINLPLYERLVFPAIFETQARELIKSFKGLNIGFDKNNEPFIIRIK